MNIYLDSLDIYFNLLSMRDSSEAELTLNAIEDLGIASQENRDAINDCEEVLDRPAIRTVQDETNTPRVTMYGLIDTLIYSFVL